MIIWLNGPFGVGKTRLAHELQSRLPGSFIFDPEQLGFTLQNLTPPNKRLSDFQEYPLWRMMVRETLHHAAGGDIPIIVPMTLVDPRYFAEIVTHLHSSGVTVHHVALLASRQTTSLGSSSAVTTPTRGPPSKSTAAWRGYTRSTPPSIWRRTRCPLRR